MSIVVMTARFFVSIVCISLTGQAIAASSFPDMEISRDSVKYEWPFTVDKGTLTCVDMGRRYVFFREPWLDMERDDDGNLIVPRSVMVATDPLALMATIENRELYLPFSDLETLLRRLEPFYVMGHKLCDENMDAEASK